MKRRSGGERVEKGKGREEKRRSGGERVEGGKGREEK